MSDQDAIDRIEIIDDKHQIRQCRKIKMDGGERTASSVGFRSKSQKIDNGKKHKKDKPKNNSKYELLRSYIFDLKNTEEYEFIPEIKQTIDDLIANIEFIDTLPDDLNIVEFNYREYATKVKRINLRRYRQYHYRRHVGKKEYFIDNIPF